MLLHTFIAIAKYFENGKIISFGWSEIAKDMHRMMLV